MRDTTPLSTRPFLNTGGPHPSTTGRLRLSPLIGSALEEPVAEASRFSFVAGVGTVAFLAEPCFQAKSQSTLYIHGQSLALSNGM